MNRTAPSVSSSGRRTQTRHTRWLLLIYDLIIYLATIFVLLVFHPSLANRFTALTIAVIGGVGALCIFAVRFLTRIYRQIWRYGGIQSYIRLLISDCVAAVLFLFINGLIGDPVSISAVRVLAVCMLNLMLSLSARMIYYYVYQISRRPTEDARKIRRLMRVLFATDVDEQERGADTPSRLIKVAIAGAGRVGVTLAEELLSNSRSAYVPVCFIDTSREKTGRNIRNLPVLDEKDITPAVLDSFGVQEIIFALPHMDAENKKRLYERYQATGCKIKVYDYPVIQNADNSGKRQLREFDVEDLLFRRPVEFDNNLTREYYSGKTILVTGGGGSIGSELCRQLVTMNPKKLVILDIYENGAYDVQQELKMRYGSELALQIEILSITDRPALERVFAEYRPDVVINAAAHKHVPLMEHNCVEALTNNVFGMLNTAELAEKYGAEHYIMVSTDKAVNPTNVMGATKRVCEMIAQSFATDSKTIFSATRFGNVLGSAGSVIPLFKRQIAAGGPVTVTDKRIIRYFMTIPEASRLVLESGAMARKGELFALDMGRPVKILDLAENIIRLSGLEPYVDIPIVETGLRPGEKLYEEILIDSSTMDKTANNSIFIERDTPLNREELYRRLAVLRTAADAGTNEAVRAALAETVPTFHPADEVNAVAQEKIRKLNSGEAV